MNSSQANAQTARCCVCGIERSKSPGKAATTRIPNGWKRGPDYTTYCAKCWHANYMLRAVSLPVSCPVGETTWDQFRDLLNQCWWDTTRLVNWTVRQLYASEPERTSATAKLSPLPYVYLYPAARKFVPELPPQSVSSVLTATQRTYRMQRYRSIGLGIASLPNARYPQPFPAHNQSWRYSRGVDGEPLLSVRLPGRRVLLRLRGGASFARQLKALDQLTCGVAIQSECALLQRKDRNTGRSAVVAKCLVWLPRPANYRRDRTGGLTVTTSPDGLWEARCANDQEPWLYDGEHLRTLVVGHGKRLRKWQLRARSASPVLRAKLDTERKKACAKQANRTRSLLQQAVASLMKYAERCGVAGICYDDQDRSYCDALPWSSIRELIANSADERGLSLTYAEDNQLPATDK